GTREVVSVAAPLSDATLAEVRLSLRPILMTYYTYIFAMVPLVTSSGAGAASRIAVGTGVMGGMIAAMLFGIFFTPLFYVAIRRWVARRPELARHRDTGVRDAPASGRRRLLRRDRQFRACAWHTPCTRSSA